MTTEQKVARRKLSMLELAKELNNVSYGASKCAGGYDVHGDSVGSQFDRSGSRVTLHGVFARPVRDVGGVASRSIRRDVDDAAPRCIPVYVSSGEFCHHQSDCAAVYGEVCIVRTRCDGMHAVFVREQGIFTEFGLGDECVGFIVCRIVDEDVYFSKMFFGKVEQFGYGVGIR